MWAAFLALEPPLEERIDVHAARDLWMRAEINRDPKRQRVPLKLEDFLLRWDGAAKPRKRLDWRVLKARIRSHLCARKETE